VVHDKKMINLRGSLLTTVISFAGTALIRLVSSVILTRILNPEVYGVIATLMSIAVAIEMLSDIGVLGLAIRHQKGDDRVFLNSMWTIRLVRGIFNGTLLFVCAPWIASLYNTPVLADALRIYSLSFVLHGMESMAFILAVRRQKVYIVNYTELVCSLVTVPFVVFVSLHTRDYHGILYGMLLNRLLVTTCSYFFFKEERPKPQIDRQYAKDLFNFTKFVAPSSAIAFLIGQFDRIIFLRLYDLRLFGLYGLAGNVSGSAVGLVEKIARSVLYPRCAEDVRNDRSTAHLRYYRANVKIWLVILTLPAFGAGAADLIVQILYDPRYDFAGTILRAFLVAGMIKAIAAPAENLLVAAGHNRVVLIGNVLRISWIVPGCLLGNHFWGFTGFLYVMMLESLPAMVYLLWLQYRDGMMVVRYELMKFGYMAALFSFTWFASSLIDLHALHDRLRHLF
jgi:O-antigen/teichoic acid export membrane protein